MARDAVDLKESLGALVMRPRSVQRTHQAVDLCAKEDPGNRALLGDLETQHEPAPAAGEEPR